MYSMCAKCGCLYDEKDGVCPNCNKGDTKEPASIRLVKKMEQFVESLLDDEFDCLLNDMVDYEEIYNEFLEQEKESRQHKADIGAEGVAEEYLENVCLSESVDFIFAQRINQEIGTLTADETKDMLTNLITKSKSDLSDKEKAQLLYTIEACELHLYELNV